MRKLQVIETTPKRISAFGHSNPGIILSTFDGTTHIRGMIKRRVKYELKLNQSTKQLDT